MNAAKRQAIVLFAHGSRDADWAKPLYAIEQALKYPDPTRLVALAFLEIGQPDLMGAITALQEAGANCVTVLPLFLGVGKHLRSDLPALVANVREQCPNITIEVLPALGEHPQFASWVASLALGTACIASVPAHDV